MFAFLNDTHEANVAVYTPARAGQAGRDLAPTRRRSKPTCNTAIPTGRTAWRRGKSRFDRTSRNGRCSASRWTIFRRAVSSELPMKDGSILAQGYAPTKHTVEFTASTTFNDHGRPPGIAHRSQSSARRSGPLHQRDVCTHRVPGGGRARRRLRTKFTKLKIVKATADVNLARNAAGSQVRRQERQAARHRSRSNSPSTARTKPPGASMPARACGISRAKRSSCSKKPVAIPKGTMLTFSTQAESRRLEQRRQSEQQPGPLPPVGYQRPRRDGRSAAAGRARDLEHPAGEAIAGSRFSAIFSYWRTTVPEWKPENDAIDALWREHPEGSLAARAGRAGRRSPRRRTS